MENTLVLFRILIASTLLALTACGSGGSSSNSTPAKPPAIQTAQGVFLDSAVEGLGYRSGTLTGFTDNTGAFQYEVGETVTFSIGDIVIGTATGADTIMPLELVASATDATDPMVINIARFLQTLDDDGDPDNGITILVSVRDLAADLTINFDQSIEAFTDDGEVQTAITTLTTVTNAGARMLVTAAAAQAHLNNTLQLLSGDDSPSNSGPQITISGDESAIIGTTLVVTDIAYGYEDFTGVEQSVLMTGGGLDIDSLVGLTDAPTTGFYLAALDAGVEFAGALWIVVDGEKFEYECTINCSLTLNLGTRTALLNDASFINTVSGSEILLNGAVAWTEDDEVVDSVDDGDSGPDGNGTVCAANLATDTGLQGNNAYAFTVNEGECLGLVESNVEKAELPLTILGDVQGLIFDETVKVAKSVVNLTTASASLANIFWYYTFNVTNTSNDLVCVRFDNGQTLDVNNTLINEYYAYVDGNYFNNSSRDCISPGQTLPVYGNNTKTLSTDDPEFTRGAIANLHQVSLDVDLRIQTLTAQESLQANYFEWQNSGIEASFTNTLGSSIELQDDALKLRYFDSEGFYVSRESINLYDALGIDKNDLQSSDHIVPAGGTLILADDVADIAHLTLRPATATNAVIFLEWRVE